MLFSSLDGNSMFIYCIFVSLYDVFTQLKSSFVKFARFQEREESSYSPGEKIFFCFCLSVWHAWLVSAPSFCKASRLIARRQKLQRKLSLRDFKSLSGSRDCIRQIDSKVFWRKFVDLQVFSEIDQFISRPLKMFVGGKFTWKAIY